ncbi:MAG: hypothetical protein ACRDRF_15945, partial [Pseudonocardiaceae bacterium]
QFIFGDGAGGVERVRVDLSGAHLEHLCTALDTTPDALRGGPAAVELPSTADLAPEEGRSPGPSGIGPAAAARTRA